MMKREAKSLSRLRSYLPWQLLNGFDKGFRVNLSFLMKISPRMAVVGAVCCLLPASCHAGDVTNQCVDIGFFHRMKGAGMEAFRDLDPVQDYLRFRLKSTRSMVVHLSVAQPTITGGEQVLAKLQFENAGQTNITWKLFYGSTLHVVLANIETDERILGAETPQQTTCRAHGIGRSYS